VPHIWRRIDGLPPGAVPPWLVSSPFGYQAASREWHFDCGASSFGVIANLAAGAAPGGEMPRITGLADSPMTNELACGQDSCGETRWRRPRMDSLWSFYYWIEFCGPFWHGCDLGAMLAGSLYWLLGAR